MTHLIERVARAIADAYDMDPDGVDPSDPLLKNWQRCTKPARAAIEAVTTAETDKIIADILLHGRSFVRKGKHIPIADVYLA